MPSGRRQVSYEGLRYDAITKKIDNSTITFDATKTNGSAGVGQAVTIVAGTVDAVALAADGDRIRKMQPAEQHLVVIDLPAAADHDEHRDGIDPVHDPDWQWMKNLSHLARSPLQ